MHSKTISGTSKEGSSAKSGIGRREPPPLFGEKVWFPRPHVVNGFYKFVEAEVDDFVRQEAGLPKRPPEPPGAPVTLIGIATFAERLDVSTRTIKRRIRETYGAAPAGLRQLELA
jgi:hypothetical protein